MEEQRSVKVLIALHNEIHGYGIFFRDTIMQCYNTGYFQYSDNQNMKKLQNNICGT